MRKLLFLAGIFLIHFSSLAQSDLDLWLWPNPGLPRNAASPMFQDSLSLRPFEVHNPIFLPNRINQPLSKQYQFDLPDGNSEMEFWFFEHGNEPIGLELFVGNQVLLGLWNHQWQLGNAVASQQKWNKRFTHLVIQRQANTWTFWENGKLIGTQELVSNSDQLYIQSYLQQESYFNLDHWIKHLAIKPNLSKESEIQKSFLAHQEWTQEGIRIPGKLHFVAEPYLYAPDAESMNITVETNEKSSLFIQVGESIPFMNKPSPAQGTEGVQTFELKGLKPGSQYFYQLKGKNQAGEEIDSGVLTFKTPEPAENPILFGVVSDTEARPWVNEQIGQKLWEERVDFVIHMGDITDGGEENNKFEWTQEFFPGSSALFSRVTHVPVAGNGEGDIFWYKYYHPQANELGAYRYSNGPGDFYVLNSNEMDELQPGGAQYEWLKTQLQQNKADWKFVQMHHAPYSSDENDYGNTWEGSSTWGNRKLQPLLRLLEQEGVDVMFFGHLHTYMRTFPLFEDQVNEEKGIHYIQLGGMGGNLEDFAPARPHFATKNFRGYHYGVVALTSHKFELKVYNADGSLIDLMEIEK